MKKRSFVILAVVALMASAGAGLGGYSWATAHVRRWSGRQGLGLVSCDHCHLVDLTRISWARPRPHHAAPGGLAVSPDGTKIYVALDDLDEVVEADTTSGKVLRRAKVVGSPFGLALDPRGEQLFATCRTGDRLASIDIALFKETGSTAVGSGPVDVSVCQTKAGQRLVVANGSSDDISVVSTAPLLEVARVGAGREPYAVDVSPDGTRAFVANRMSITPNALSVPASELTILDPLKGRVITRYRLESAHLSEGVAYVPSRALTLTPLVKVRNLIPITQVANGWVMSSGLAVSDAKGNVVQMPIDEAQDYFADPSAIAVDPAGKRAYLASGGSDVITVIDLDRLTGWIDRADAAARREAIEDLSLSAEYVLARVPTGRNPRQLAMSPDGRRLFVAERLEDAVLVIDTATLKPSGRIVLGDGGLDDPIRRGERVFTRAAHTFQRQFSCRSCHPDVHVDGLSYDFDGDGIGDNLLDNRTLQGIAGTQPFKWNGKNPSLDVQCGPRFARVLMRTDPIPSAELKDLVRFIESQPPARTAHKPGTPLTTAQERGREIFFATTTSEGKPIPRERQCNTCHRPPLFTNRLLSAIGTKGPRDSTDMFDTPQLLGVASTAPYLHDGRAKTLEELWTVYQTNDLHGVTSYMNKHQLNDLIDYLKTL